MLKVYAILVVLLVLLSPRLTSAQTVPIDCRGVPVVETDSIIQDRDDLSYLYDGFCLEFGEELLFYGGYPSSRFLGSYGPEYYQTDAHYYDDELMDLHLASMGIDLVAIGAEDGIAMQPCPHALDKSMALITFPGVDHQIPVVVVDCVSPEHQEFRQSYYRSAIDLPFRLAEKYGFTGNGGIEGVIVCMDLVTPEITCSGEPVRFYDWFWDNFSYER